MKALIYVTLKPSVLDPQGRAVLGGLHALGFAAAEDVRVGKFIEVGLAAGLARSEAEPLVRAMCDKLLANPVIETCRFEIVEESA